jgi:serine/threonine protein kinase
VSVAPAEFTDLHPPRIGQVVADRYEVLAFVGKGGMSLVYRVRDRVEGDDAALKVLRPELATWDRVRHRLASEAVTMMMLDHPHIVRVRDMGTDPESQLSFFVVDWAPGGSAGDRAKREGPQPVTRVARWGVEVACALSLAHARGIVHRDVKPGNILLGDGDRALLADFGVAYVPDADADTDVGAVLGSMSYMAPEQRLSPSDVGPPADVYGLGATLYHLATRKNPADLFACPEDDPRWEVLPAPLRPVVLRATRHRTDRRYPDALALGRALAALVPAEVWVSEPWLQDWLDGDQDG